MKRRGLLIAGLMSGLSGAVFTATGWLMGNKTLTMAAYHWTAQPYQPCCSHGWVWGEQYNGCFPFNVECNPKGNCYSSCTAYFCSSNPGQICDIICQGNMNKECCSEYECNA